MATAADRRHTVTQLQDIAAAARLIIGEWRPDGGFTRRAELRNVPLVLPEHDPAQWAVVARTALAIADQALALAEFAATHSGQLSPQHQPEPRTKDDDGN